MIPMVVLGTILALGGGLACNSSDDDEDSVSSNGLNLSPGSFHVGAGVVTNVLFSASGGTPPYAWSVQTAALGSLVATGDKAIYTCNANAGQNFVTVTDHATNFVSATIVHD